MLGAGESHARRELKLYRALDKTEGEEETSAADLWATSGGGCSNCDEDSSMEHVEKKQVRGKNLGGSTVYCRLCWWLLR